MSLLDCLADGGKRCGTLSLFANLSPDPVSLEIQYPGNDNVWYTIGAFRPGEMFQLIERHRVTHIKVVPALLIRLINDPSITDHQLDSVQLIQCGGKITQGEQNLFYLPNNAFS